MSFKESDVAELLVRCHRRCCICHKFCGVKMEIHHIEYSSKKGSDDIENGIPLCFECHAEVNHYNPAHPKGRKFSDDELLGHKKQWLEICEKNPGFFVTAPLNRDVGPLEGMLLELEFNLDTVGLVTGPESWQGKIGCPLLREQYQRAIAEGTLYLLPEDLRKIINRAYSEVGKVNSFVVMYTSQEPEGNAFAEATNRLLEALRKSEQPIGDALSNLKKFLSVSEGE